MDVEDDTAIEGTIYSSDELAEIEGWCIALAKAESQDEVATLLRLIPERLWPAIVKKLAVNARNPNRVTKTKTYQKRKERERDGGMEH